MSMFGRLNEESNKQMEQKRERRRFKWPHIVLLLLLIVGTVYVAKDNKSRDGRQDKEYRSCKGNVFGTYYHITYGSGKDLQTQIDSVLTAVDNSLSTFNKNSTLSKINSNTCMETDAMFRHVFTLAKEVSRNTYGAFDVTVAPLVNAWGFGFKNKENVTDSLVQELKKHVGFNRVRLDDDMIVKEDSAMMLDFSAIAKGYGVDAVGICLEQHGVHDYMIEIGGEIRLRGQNPKGEKWSIGIVKPDPDPTGTNEELEEVLNVTDLAMATSGNYRNFYVEGNKRYAHTIDPHTGYPAQSSLLSATVLADDCALADAYATAFMVLGIEKAKDVLEKHPELKAYMIYTDKNGKNATWHTGNLKVE